IARSSEPFGPFTETWRSAIFTSTPEGTGMGLRPTRDISATSPDVAEDLAAHATLARLAVGHETLARGQDSYTETAEHTRHVLGLGVDPETRLGDAPEPGDHPLALGRVLHGDRERVAGAIVRRRHLEALDVTLGLQQLRQCELLLRGRHPHVIVHRDVRVAD